MSDLQSTGQRVMVRNSHKIHAPVPGYGIEFLRFGVAFRAADFSQDPLGRLFQILGMNMKISLQ